MDTLKGELSLADNHQIDEPRLKRAVFKEQVRIFIIRKRILHVAGPCSGAYFAFLMSEYIAMPIVLFWWSALALVDFTLVFVCTLYLNKDISHENRQFWCQGHIFGLVISGFIWGLSIILFYTPQLQGQLYNIVMLVVVGSFSAVVLIPIRAAYFAFFTTTISPAFIFYIWLGDFAHVNLAVGIVVVGIVTSAFQASATAHFVESIEKKYRSIELAKALSLSLEKIKELASRDYLTGLYNRRFGMEGLNHELHRRERYQENLTLGIMDIDHFKQINDGHGHLVGDAVLVEFSRRITELLRDEDTFFRYGGEEFVVIFPHTKLDDAQLVAERMRRTICDMDFIVAHKSIAVTVSIGISEFENGDTVEHRISLADNALYKAKNSGRNRVEVYSP